MNNITIDILDKLLYVYNYSLQTHTNIESNLKHYIDNYDDIKFELFKLDLIEIDFLEYVGDLTYIMVENIPNYKRILKLKNIIYEL